MQINFLASSTHDTRDEVCYNDFVRIGIFDPYLDDIGGGEKYMITLASILAENNNVDVFWDNPADLELVGTRFSIDTAPFKVVKNVFTPSISLLERFLETRKYGAIVILSDGSIPLVGSRKLFVHIQQPLQEMQSGFLGKLKLSRVTAFFCNSHYTQSFIDRKFNLHTKVVYPPVALHPKEIKKENIILHVGRFRAKNVENGDFKKQFFMVEAFKDMVDNGFKNWKFILAVSFGEKDKDLFAKMEKSAKGYPIEFLINKSNRDLWKIFSKSKIYWHASGYGEELEKHPEFAEHFGISTVEAMGAGCVPVVINAGGQTEIITNGENGFLWNTQEDLQNLTLKLVKDRQLWVRLSISAKEEARKFGYESFKKNILALIS